MYVLEKSRSPSITQVESDMSLAVPSTPDAVIHEGHDSGRYDNAIDLLVGIFPRSIRGAYSAISGILS